MINMKKLTFKIGFFIIGELVIIFTKVLHVNTLQKQKLPEDTSVLITHLDFLKQIANNDYKFQKLSM